MALGRATRFLSQSKPKPGLDAEQAPASIIQLERRLIAEEVVAGDLEGAASTVLQNDVEVVPCSQALLHAAIFRLRVVADGLRRHAAGDIGLPLPDVPVHLEHPVAEVTGRLADAEPHRRPRFRREDGRGGIAADLRVRHRVGRIDVAGVLQRRAGIETEAEPHRLAAVVDPLVAAFLGVIGTLATGNTCLSPCACCRADRLAVPVPKIDGALGPRGRREYGREWRRRSVRVITTPTHLI